MKLTPFKLVALLMALLLSSIGAYAYFSKPNDTSSRKALVTSTTPTSNTVGTPAKSALTVSVTQAESRQFHPSITANGTVAAWQEASVSAEVSGLRLIDINAAVGDIVQKGQVLARFDTATLNADISATQAQLAEAKANSDEARANAERARELAKQGFYSKQAISQTNSQEQASVARLDAAKANLALQQLRLDHSVLRAPDSGVITARNAAIGSVVSAGMELFRLNRQGRLEWRGEVTSSEVPTVKLGSTVTLEDNNTGISKTIATGVVRQIAPNLDPHTRNAIVYVDLAASNTLKVGQFVRGKFAGASITALTVPSNSVVLRDGFNYVFVIKNSLNTNTNTNTNTQDRTVHTVVQTKVGLGQRQDNIIEVTSGLSSDAQVVTTGTAFLSDGDTVTVVKP
jgi:HlyD family secretion protein